MGMSRDFTLLVPRVLFEGWEFLGAGFEGRGFCKRWNFGYGIRCQAGDGCWGC